MNFGPCRDKRRGARIRAGQAEYGVSPRDQFWDNGGADESSRAGNKDPHKTSPRWRNESRDGGGSTSCFCAGASAAAIQPPGAEHRKQLTA
jgi:hypothetical protein